MVGQGWRSSSRSCAWRGSCVALGLVGCAQWIGIQALDDAVHGCDGGDCAGERGAASSAGAGTTSPGGTSSAGGTTLVAGPGSLGGGGSGGAQPVGVSGASSIGGASGSSSEEGAGGDGGTFPEGGASGDGGSPSEGGGGDGGSSPEGGTGGDGGTSSAGSGPEADSGDASEPEPEPECGDEGPELWCADPSTPRRCVDGSWQSWPVCDDETPFCLRGDCVECEPESKECVNNGVRTCDADGAWTAASECPLESPNPVCVRGFCSYRAGAPIQGPTTDTLMVGFLYAVSFDVAAPSRVYRLGMFGTAGGNQVRMGIYASGADELPSEPIAVTSTFATADGRMEAPVAAAAVLTEGQRYWIVAIADTDIGMRVTLGEGAYALNNNPEGWNVLPAAFPPGTSQNPGVVPNFYAVLRDF